MTQTILLQILEDFGGDAEYHNILDEYCERTGKDTHDKNRFGYVRPKLLQLEKFNIIEEYQPNRWRFVE